MSTMPRYAYLLMLVLVMLMWSGNSVVARAIHEDIPPFTLAFLRWTGAALIAIPLTWRYLRRDMPVAVAHWPIILLLGVVGVGSFNAFMYSGLQYTTAANSLLVQAAIPALVLLFNFLLFKEHPRRTQIIGVIVAALGVGMIIFQGNFAVLLSMDFNRGDVLVLFAVMLWAIYTVLLRLRPAINGLSFLTLTIVIGALCMAPFAAWELREESMNFTSAVIWGIAYVTIFPSLLAYFLFNTAVDQLGAGDAGQVINLQPVFGALLAALLLSEPIHSYHLVGMALILLGIAIPFLGRRERAGAPH